MNFIITFWTLHDIFEILITRLIRTFSVQAIELLPFLIVIRQTRKLLFIYVFVFYNEFSQ